ncbi:E3 ubiquitin-protein ligase AMFR-like isoform X2 [Photinus pyralis]|uniref:E3 ubiquitin-protein ligase AMFR-like isoform X2 n=1 Tax=Photinus pyralis TaxID=7054 RepID=UPI0012677B44|nr:E3 ubiquitin-protein ligase AMFR-like isoform X2 [Photinus pyralis]
MQSLIMINMAYCWLILIGRCVQKFVFGQLRVSEQQHLEEKFWNFVFYKFIFVFGVINVQYLEEVLLWCSWFSLLGFLHLLSQLGKDRFEYLSFSPTTPAWSHVKLLGLLGSIFVFSLFMLLICIFVGFFQGLNTFAFMSAEVILLGIRTLHVIVRYALHLYDMCRDTNGSLSRDTATVLEKRGPVIYYIELGFELTALIIDFVHHMHMLLWSNIFLSMASLVICMQLRYLFHEMQRRCKKHRNYLWVLNHMEQNYPMASAEEIAANSDNCAICWEKMETARKLPCSHLFHTMCLQSWLEQDKSCPTCRLALNIENPSDNRPESPEIQHNAPQPARRPLNHFFHFDGSRYVSWLPSFSVEVSQLPRLSRAPASNSQLDAMARQVQQLFPHYLLPIIIEDLRVTRSVELTIENILDGRLNSPTFRETEPIVPSENNPSLSILQRQSSTEQPDTSTSQNWDEVNEENVDNDDGIAVGSRFSKSSSEREHILHKRKEKLIQSARKRYVDKQRATPNS